MFNEIDRGNHSRLSNTVHFAWFTTLMPLQLYDGLTRGVDDTMQLLFSH
eukprot:COSAG02_NODE_68_length_42582_cov_52.351129_14_plen_49_part_00